MNRIFHNMLPQHPIYCMVLCTPRVEASVLTEGQL
jgi:hypothetical protein